MGWLRLVGSLKLYVSFAKELYKRRYSAKETYNFQEPTNRSHPIPQTSWANPVQCYSTHQERHAAADLSKKKNTVLLLWCLQNVYTGWRKCIGCLVLIGHFPQKRPIIIGVFVESDVQLKVSDASTAACSSKRPRELDHWLRSEIEEMTLQIQQAVARKGNKIRCFCCGDSGIGTAAAEYASSYRALLRNCL